MGRVLKASGVPAPAAPAETEATRNQAAALFETARREGLASGHAEAVAQATALLAAARVEAARALAAVTPAAIALAGKMAQKIVGRAVEVDRGVMAEIVAEALATCRPDVASLRIRVHPQDLPDAEQRRGQLAARVPAAPIELVADESVGRYGCVIDTPRGRIDARLETQLAALERALGGEASRD